MNEYIIPYRIRWSKASEHSIDSCLASGHTCSLFHMSGTEKDWPSPASPLHGYASIPHIHGCATASLGGGQQCVSFAYKSTERIRAERMITPQLWLSARDVGVVVSHSVWPFPLFSMTMYRSLSYEVCFCFCVIFVFFVFFVFFHTLADQCTLSVKQSPDIEFLFPHSHLVSCSFITFTEQLFSTHSFSWNKTIT